MNFFIPIIENFLYFDDNVKRPGHIESDSEYSDTELLKARSKPEWKVQYHALECLEAYSKVNLIVSFLSLAMLQTNAL